MAINIQIVKQSSPLKPYVKSVIPAPSGRHGDNVTRRGRCAFNVDMSSPHVQYWRSQTNPLPEWISLSWVPHSLDEFSWLLVLCCRSIAEANARIGCVVIWFVCGMATGWELCCGGALRCPAILLRYHGEASYVLRILRSSTGTCYPGAWYGPCDRCSCTAVMLLLPFVSTSTVDFKRW